MSWRLEWAGQKLDIARRLADGECGGGYPEAILIIGAVISGLAVQRWPGPRIDKKRFVELLIVASPGTALISTPLLVGTLRAAHLNTEAEQIRIAQRLTEKSRVVFGDEVDTSESRIHDLCPALELTTIRNQSYASILYTELRSPYVHEYSTGDRAGSVPMTRADCNVSYINRIRNDGASERLIHMTVPFLIETALHAAAYCDKCDDEIERKHPAKWWLEGA